MKILPTKLTLHDYRLIYRDFETWLPAMRTICSRHHLDQTQLALGPPGTHIVFFAGPSKVIKLFAPIWPDDYLTESLVLKKISGNEKLKCPQYITTGDLEGWPYLIMNKVQGIPIEDTWKTMPFSDKRRIVQQLGEMMTTLHELPIDDLKAIDVDWPNFIQTQVQNCLKHHADSGASKLWLEMIKEFLEHLPMLFEPGFQKSLIHADITIEHIFVNQTKKGWEITGFIDFGDAMVGHPLYDFAAPSFITLDTPELQFDLLRSYGFSSKEINETLSQQLLAYVLLHKYGNLPDYLKLFGYAKPRDLESFQKALWPF